MKWVCHTQHHGVLPLITLVSLADRRGGAVLSWNALMRTANDTPTDGGRPRQRARFMADPRRRVVRALRAADTRGSDPALDARCLPVASPSSPASTRPASSGCGGPPDTGAVSGRSRRWRSRQDGCRWSSRLSPPLDEWSEQWLAAHMVQHELLMVVAAPLMAVGAPLVGILWAMPSTAAARARDVGPAHAGARRLAGDHDAGRGLPALWPRALDLASPGVVRHSAGT